MFVFTNGCSHTAGHCVSKPYTWPELFMNSIVKEYTPLYPYIEQRYDWNEYIDYSCNSVPIPEDLNVWYGNTEGNHKLLELSDHGKSNEEIYYETLHFLLELENRNNLPDIVIIQWSGVNRRLHTEPSRSDKIEEGIVRVNPKDNSELGLLFEPYASKHTLQMMLHLQTYLKSKNIPYVFIPYMRVRSENKYLIELNYLDASRLTCSVLYGHTDEFRNRYLTCDYGHPNLLGCYVLTSKILEVLNLKDFEKGLGFHFKSNIIEELLKDKGKKLI